MSESEFVNDVSDANFDAEVLQSDRPVLVDFGRHGARPAG